MTPQLPSLQTLDSRFDGLLIDEQVAMWVNMAVMNDYRRSVAESLLARCGKWIRDVE